MDWLATHLTAMVDVGTGTIALFLFICGTAVWLVRNHVASVFTLLFAFPLVLGLTFLINYLCILNGLYDPKKMTDWIVWTTMTATAGTMGGIGMIAAFARLWEREATA